MVTPLRKTRYGFAALIAGGAVVLAGCGGAGGGGGGGGTTEPTGDPAPPSDEVSALGCTPTTDDIVLEYWSWGAGYEDAAMLWNETHPNIQVRYSDIPVGNSGGYQKVFTAITADEAPDVVFIEFDNVPAFATEGALLDVAPLIGATALEDFVPGFADQVALTGEGSMNAVPLGGGPMALFYRSDLFEEHGIEVPTTWEEYAAAAAAVREAVPDAYLTNFDGGGNANWFAGLAAQNGAQWFGVQDGTWTVSVDGAETREVAAYWEDLLVNDLASALATFSPEWNAALAEGRLWSWPSAVWGAGVIQASTPDLAGSWAVVQLPIWGPDKPAAASWGGGGLAVVNTTDHPCEAAQFALWMGTDVEAMKILNAAIGIWPTTHTLLADPLFGEPVEFFGGQPIFTEFTKATDGLASFVWGPQMTDTYAAVTNGFTPPLGARGAGLADSLAGAQTTVVDALTRQGFAVER